MQRFSVLIILLLSLFLVSLVEDMLGHGTIGFGILLTFQQQALTGKENWNDHCNDLLVFFKIIAFGICWNQL